MVFFSSNASNKWVICFSSAYLIINNERYKRTAYYYYQFVVEFCFVFGVNLRMQMYKKKIFEDNLTTSFWLPQTITPWKPKQDLLLLILQITITLDRILSFHDKDLRTSLTVKLSTKTICRDSPKLKNGEGKKNNNSISTVSTR